MWSPDITCDNGSFLIHLQDSFSSVKVSSQKGVSKSSPKQNLHRKHYKLSCSCRLVLSKKAKQKAKQQHAVIRSVHIDCDSLRLG